MHMSPPPRLHGASDSGNEHLDDLLREAERPHSPHTALHYPAPEQRLPPVVLVEGFFSFFNEVNRTAQVFGVLVTVVLIFLLAALVFLW